MGRQLKWFSRALKKSKNSKHPKQKMAALVVKSGRVLAMAVNGKRTGRHAEVRAVAQDRDFEGATIYVARLGKGISKPCRSCFLLIKQAGIKKMVFVDEDNRLTEKIAAGEDSDNYKDYDA